MKYDVLTILLCLTLAASSVLALSFHIKLWPFELLVSFAMTILYILGAVLSLVLVLAVYKQASFAPLTAALLLISSASAAYCLGYALHVQPVEKVAAHTKASITFATFNREFSNDNVEPAAEYLKQQNIDVLALQETNPAITKQLSEKVQLPHRYNATRLNMVQGTSTALVSKYPFKETSTVRLSDYSSMVRAVVTLPGNNDVAFYSLHLAGPFSPDRYTQRNADSTEAARILAAEKLPTVLGGDFNTTIYSPILVKFNSAIFNTLKPTTTSSRPQCSRFSSSFVPCLRIDHVYIPQQFELTETYVSPHLGSDHRAVVVRIAF